ncbi:MULTISPECIES: glucose-1-phosphate adenylyltransferase [Anaerostipes]|uniref:glucose-1-phosphate adenylyltransferase n=1 Tax=Anaerostipes TaxID=207244 RepID=UPI000951D543|nr:glucose-1-phosphate adenylyltransferase [Anaerostipes faecalis]MCI5623531.1 glucose-1-phosphate adenylyltransferase [Anaerostipes sp.]OLR58825.1 glucose-1-phosphate adenylyltransferase [Anaerostipes sp. 494a]
MINKKEIVAMLLAGGQGSRLYALTQKKAKPAVSYGGKYKIIDFPLSNCSNSGIDTVGVLTQYEPLELNSYIGTGGPWDLDSITGGAYVLPPYVRGEQGNWYRGTADAIYQNINFIDNYDPEYIIVLSGDQICTMDYNKMLAYHKEKGADCTISVLNVTYEEAKRFGIMNTDEDNRIYEFEEKPAEPKSTKASMGLYIFNYKLIRQYLIDDANDPDSAHDFGMNIIPRLLEEGKKMYAYDFEGYWRDVGTIDSLWEANMELLDPNSPVDLDDDKMKIYTRNYALPPHFVTKDATVKNSILADGCVVEGDVENCVIHPGVKIGKGSVVKNSVIMSNTVIRENCTIDKALIDEEVVVEKGCTVGEGDNVTVIGYRSVALENATIEDGAMVYPDSILH